MNFKKVLIFSLILFILSVSFVSAADLNKTHETELSCVGDNSLAVENFNSKTTCILDSENLINEQQQDTSPGTFDNLQAEINKASAGSVLDLYRDYNGYKDAVVHLDKDLIIDGHGHTINGKNAEGCVPFESDSGFITLKNLNIINGRNDDSLDGGVIRIFGSAKYTIDNCTFRNNFAEGFGGAISNYASDMLVITNCLFDSNSADRSGGAIYSRGEVYVVNSIFKNNKAREGGAIYTFDGTEFTIIYSEFIDNHAEDDGGAVYGTSVGEVHTSKFTGNSAEKCGGAFYCKKGVYFYRCTFDRNRAEHIIFGRGGGAICASYDVKICNCTFMNNYANNCGGAIYANTVTFDGTPSTSYPILQIKEKAAQYTQTNSPMM